MKSVEVQKKRGRKELLQNPDPAQKKLVLQNMVAAYVTKWLGLDQGVLIKDDI